MRKLNKLFFTICFIFIPCAVFAGYQIPDTGELLSNVVFGSLGGDPLNSIHKLHSFNNLC